MSRDRTLEEFVPTEESTETAPDADASSDGSSETRDFAQDDDEKQAAPAGDDQSDPLLSTFAYDESGGRCATCGEPSAERWRDGSGLVCGECKEW